MFTHLQYLLKECQPFYRKPSPNYNLIIMKKTLLKSFDGIKLNHGDTLSWEFNDSFENPFEYVAHLYKIEKEESDLTPLQNFKKGLKNILRQISIGDDDIIYYDDILRIEGISWNEKFTIDWSLIEELKLYVKGTDVKLEMNTTEYDDSGIGVTMR